MELRQLRYFVAVAEERHFGRAAIRLAMSQPPLSSQIRKLEDELKVELLERNSRNVRLTPAGRTFLEHARRVLDEANQALEAVRAPQHGALAQLRLGYTMAASYQLLPALLEQYARLRPDVEVVARHIPNRQQVRALEEQQLDVGIIRPPVHSPRLRAVTILRAPFVAVLPADHRLAGDESVDLKQLADERFVMWSRHTSMRERVVALCEKNGFSPTISHVATAEHLLVNFVADGLGVALVPACKPTERVVVKPLRAVKDRTLLAVVWRKSDRSEPVSSFVSAATSSPRSISIPD